MISREVEASAVACQQREGAHIVRPLEIGEAGRIFAGEAGVAILRLLVVAAGFADRAIEAVYGEETELIDANGIRHLRNGHARGE